MSETCLLSIVVITLNEAHNIRDCLESVRWADEIIVVDSGSTDGTQEICREYTENVFVMDWPGFGMQKNRALEKASGQWVLSIDADERVTKKLRDEIQRRISPDTSERTASNNVVAFSIPRLSNYCGRFLRHGGWWPDRVVRLFLRSKAYFDDAPIHERLLVDGKVGKIKSHLLHYTFRDLNQVLDTVNRYSTAGAQMKCEQGKQGGLTKAVSHGVWMFFRTYVFKAGFLDGREGFMLAVSNAEGAYYKYLKLCYLNRDNKIADK